MLNALIPESTEDATILEFDFLAKTGGYLSFEYLFASDEYPEWIASEFNDVLGIWVNGKNIAVGGNNDPVAVNTVTFNGNLSGQADLEYDGFTDLSSAIAWLDPGTANIKLAIADASDSTLDSAAFVKGSFYKVPEPSSVLALFALGGFGIFSKLKHKKVSS